MAKPRPAPDALPPLKLVWAIPDHPWHDEGAAVRIAMTVGGLEGQPWLGRVAHEGEGITPELEAEKIVVVGSSVERVHADLSAGTAVADVLPLQAVLGLGANGAEPTGMGFVVNVAQFRVWGSPQIVKPYFNGKDITDSPRNSWIIDFFGLSLEEARGKFPGPFQHVVDHVKPQRDLSNDPGRKRNWWLFGRNLGDLRPALQGLSRYIVSSKTAKHRVFVFLRGDAIPDSKLIAFAFDDAYYLGVLSSRVHLVWCDAAASNLGVGNDQTYVIRTCFDPFPFPDASEPQKIRIRDLAERLDAHRKGAQGRGVTITQMYNLRDKLTKGEAFTDKERALHEAVQTSILAQLHDEFDAAVLDAYGWSADSSGSEKTKATADFADSADGKNKKVLLSASSAESAVKPVFLSDADILTRLVALNRERAEEERQGLVRWLRPEYQAPSQSAAPIATSLGLETEPEKIEIALPEPTPWPKETREQLAAVRAAVLSAPRLWTAADLARCFKARGRYRESINAHLELLSDLGVITRLDADEGPRYHRPVALAAGS